MYILICGLLLSIASCDKFTYTPVVIPDEGAELSTLVQEELDRRNAKYMSNVQDRCREKALKAAIKHVDTLIVDLLQGEVGEGAVFPNRPTRPRLPEGIIVNDSTEIAPLGN